MATPEPARVPEPESVAREAALLARALSDRARARSSSPAAGSGFGPAKPPAAGSPRDFPSGAGPRRTAAAEARPEAENQGSDPSSGPGPGGCEECGCGATLVCAACPICRSAGLLRLFSPPALEAIADLAGAASKALRAMARRQREGSGWEHSWSGAGPDAWAGTRPYPAPAPAPDAEEGTGPVSGGWERPRTGGPPVTPRPRPGTARRTDDPATGSSVPRRAPTGRAARAAQDAPPGEAGQARSAKATAKASEKAAAKVTEKATRPRKDPS